MKAVWNAKVGLGIMSWTVASYAVTTAGVFVGRHERPTAP